MTRSQLILRLATQNPHLVHREVERLVNLGATYADVGQAEESWIVLADPEGNEFCVLSSRRS